MKMKNLLVGAALVTTALSLTGCNGGGGGSSYGAYRSPYISASSFVNALNDVDGAPLYDESYVELYTDETLRSLAPGEDDWFVIWDAEWNEYKAVSLQYVRSIVYYDYYSNNYSTAVEFRNIEWDDIMSGFGNGDLYGDDYEVVDYDWQYGVYVGRESGYYYEDETETHDVNLLAGEAEKKELFQKVANISYTYEVSIETAFSIASLGEKVEGMVKKGAAQEELTAEDQEVLMKDLEHLTGVTLEEVVAASVDGEKKQEVLGKISAKLGTSTQNLEDNLLPELLGM